MMMMMMMPSALQEVRRALEGHGVPSEKILTIEQWYPNY
jgi:hypothetical protein